MLPVTVYSKPNCQACLASERTLNKLNIPFSKVDITQSEEARERVLALGYQAAPVVIVGEDTHWSGYRPDKIKELVA